MRTEDLILVSVDDHVIEPPDMFDGRLPAKYQDHAPKLIRRDDGTDFWHYDGNEIPNIGLNAVVGRPPDEYGIEPTSLDDMRPGCYDVHERVRDMSANGVLGSMCFPSFPQFCGQLFARTARTRTRPWPCSGPTTTGTSMAGVAPSPVDSSPWRCRRSGIPELAAAEVRRVAAKGCHAVTFSENPTSWVGPRSTAITGTRSGRACADEGTVVCMHLGSSSQLIITSADAPIDVMITLQPMNMVQAAADLLWSPVLRKYDDLHFALSEGGIGWIPYSLERVDYVYQHHHAWTGQDFGDICPASCSRTGSSPASSTTPSASTTVAT